MHDTQRSDPAAPLIIPRPEHNLSRANISKNALKVLYRLKDGGFQAFLVGGGVRDLLLGREPKDFDIVTDAHPEEVRKLFRNCRLIGRRFRLAHVHFGRDIVEVATFRGSQDDVDADDADRVMEEDSGRILRDNAYGDIHQDVWRRDFTANALYYDIRDFSIWDYANGVEDVRDGVLRLMGDPATRYREDPVRMLRAARFSASLGFRLHPDSEAPLEALAPLLEDVPPARLLDETTKMLVGGYALQSFEFLRHYGLFEFLFPQTDECLDDEECDAFRMLVTHALRNTDERVAEGKPVTPMFLLAVLLWEPIRRLAEDFTADGESEIQALRLATSEVALTQQEHVSLPRRFMQAIRDMVSLQPRFRHREGRRAQRLLDHPRMRAAYDFLLLRIEAGEETPELGEFWTRIQSLDPEAREAELTVTAEPGGQRGRRRRRRRRRPRPDASPPPAD